MYASDSTNDTSVDVDSKQVDMIRRMSPSERLNKALALSAQVRQMAFAAIRRRFPDLSDDAARSRFIELSYGKDLADQVERRKSELAIEHHK